MLLGMCGLPGLGIQPLSAALAGGCFTTEPPGKSYALQSHAAGDLPGGTGLWPGGWGPLLLAMKGPL